ncbi:MAG: hypothetical protein A4E42_00052 [Methanoregulaceae archaeon PtaU1.Bin222]|nr:MAG: hypothetical protein A4E42_00052 [Methanoregulaceae archaeon PtaU1.Bin222]
MVKDLFPALFAEAALNEIFPDMEGDLLTGHLPLHLPDPCCKFPYSEQRFHTVRKVARNRYLHEGAGIDPCCPGFLGHLHGSLKAFMKIGEIRFHGGGAVHHHHHTCCGRDLSL